MLKQKTEAPKPAAAVTGKPTAALERSKSYCYFRLSVGELSYLSQLQNTISIVFLRFTLRAKETVICCTIRFPRRGSQLLEIVSQISFAIKSRTESLHVRKFDDVNTRPTSFICMNQSFSPDL